MYPDNPQISSRGLSPRVRGKRLPSGGLIGGVGSIPACAGEAAGLAAGLPPLRVYPRVCGGSRPIRGRTRRHRGLSPRVRGKPAVGAPGAARRGSIPACAGEAGVAASSLHSPRVYPRVCGGSLFVSGAGGRDGGLSPRVRGKPGRALWARRGERSIPACAGEAGHLVCTSWAVKVYPRVCGGSKTGHFDAHSSKGLSPRVRGKRLRSPRRWAALGSIPACAGEAVPFPGDPPDREVYPRVCGGSVICSPKAKSAPGLSPRVRGKRNSGPNPRICRRSIPACAGEAPWGYSRPTAVRVYPRVCGGSAMRLTQWTDHQGLSPRVRGKLWNPHHYHHPSRSIPACAGEAFHAHPVGRRGWVYPRVCGGSSGTSIGEIAPEGLSPRVRGKPCAVGGACRLGGSIPACAGEAHSVALTSFVVPVYPRVCGGSSRITSSSRTSGGLSPRVRGKRMKVNPSPGELRSIPACAGEACGGGAYPGAKRVYPRVCGGSFLPIGIDAQQQGLSPRVRGKRRGRLNFPRLLGSIPACAGEARAGWSLLPPPTVYPRVCGGSPHIADCHCVRRGLSPRVRGKRPSPACAGLRWRSIPACAGEALRHRHRRPPAEVYPRVCGGSNMFRFLTPAECGLSPRVRGKHPSTPNTMKKKRSIPACAGEAPPSWTSTPAAAVYPRVCGGSFQLNSAAAWGEGLSPRVRGKHHSPGPRPGPPGSIPACAGEAFQGWWLYALVGVYPRVCGGSGRAFVRRGLPEGLSPRVRGKRVP